MILIKKYMINTKDHSKKNSLTITPDYDTVLIGDIYIPTSFMQRPPRKCKVRRAIDFYKKHGYFDKPVTIIPETNEKGLPNKLVLVDGYARYKAAVYLHIKEIKAEYITYEEYERRIKQ